MEEFLDSDFFEDDITSSTSSCSSNSNLSARPKGLTSSEALEKLIAEIRDRLAVEPRSSWLQILRSSLDPFNETSTFPISAIIVSVLQCGFLWIKFVMEEAHERTTFLR